MKGSKNSSKLSWDANPAESAGRTHCEKRCLRALKFVKPKRKILLWRTAAEAPLRDDGAPQIPWICRKYDYDHRGIKTFSCLHRVQNAERPKNVHVILDCWARFLCSAICFHKSQIGSHHWLSFRIVLKCVKSRHMTQRENRTKIEMRGISCGGLRRAWTNE